MSVALFILQKRIIMKKYISLVGLITVAGISNAWAEMPNRAADAAIAENYGRVQSSTSNMNIKSRFERAGDLVLSEVQGTWQLKSRIRVNEFEGVRGENAKTDRGCVFLYFNDTGQQDHTPLGSYEDRCHGRTTVVDASGKRYVGSKSN